MDGEEYGYQRYNLHDVQDLILSFKANEFDNNGSSPRNYFLVLLLTLQFERVYIFMKFV